MHGETLRIRERRPDRSGDALVGLPGDREVGAAVALPASSLLAWQTGTSLP